MSKALLSALRSELAIKSVLGGRLEDGPSGEWKTFTCSRDLWGSWDILTKVTSYRALRTSGWSQVTPGLEGEHAGVQFQLL